MSKVPPRWAEALRLRHVEEHTAAEVAAIMSCRVERVYKLVQKAKQRMRDLLPGYSEGQPNTVRSVQTKQKNHKSNKHQPHRPRPVPLCGKFDATRPSSAEAFPP